MSIAIRNLAVRVHGTNLVQDISFDVAPGTWCTIIGPNGAGKTTLLSAIAGLRNVASGDVSVEGHDMHQLGERARAKLVAYVPQAPVVPVGMSVWDFVMLGRSSAHGMLRSPSSTDIDIVDGVVSRLSLSPLRKRDVATLSGGERQRVVMARTLAQGTRVVLLDEPTTGLDVRHEMEILELLKKEVDECQLTVVATLHDLTLAGLFANQMVLLHEGRVAENGSPRVVLRSDALSASYGTQLRVLDVDGRDVVVPDRLSGAPSTSA